MLSNRITTLNTSLPARHRTARGAALVEGAVGLLLVISGLVFATLLLLNSGVTVYNQEKLAFVAQTAATYAATLTNSSTRQSDLKTLASTTMANLGLDNSNMVVSVQDATLGKSGDSVSVTITAKLPTLLSANFGNLLPQQVQVSETAVALKPINPVQYLVMMNLTGQKITVPMFNNTGVLPDDGLPAWYTNTVGLAKLR